MEGMVLKLGLDPWHLSLSNAENVEFTSVFQFGYIWYQRLMSRFMPLMIYFSGITSSSYSLSR